MDDLVKRLRGPKDRPEIPMQMGNGTTEMVRGLGYHMVDDGLHKEAAERIEAQAAEIADLKIALTNARRDDFSEKTGLHSMWFKHCGENWWTGVLRQRDKIVGLKLQITQMKKGYERKIARIQMERDDLRAQLSRMIDPRALLHWGDSEMTRRTHVLCVGSFSVAVLYKKRKAWFSGLLTELSKPHPTESEARLAVERAVLKALGVSDDIVSTPPAEAPRTCGTCETCAHHAPVGPERFDCTENLSHWTPKTTASEGDGL